MKTILLFPVFALLIFGCSENKKEPPLTSYPLEIGEIIVPYSLWKSADSHSNPSKFIEHILKDPSTQTNILPLQVILGKTVEHDQTEIKPMVSDSIPFDDEGKILKKPYKIGSSAQATLISIKNGFATLKVNFYRRTFKKFNEVTTRNGKTIEIPSFDAIIFKSEISLPSDTWIVLGTHNSHAKKSEKKENPSGHFLIARIHLPASEIPAPSAGVESDSLEKNSQLPEDHTVTAPKRIQIHSSNTAIRDESKK